VNDAHPAVTWLGHASVPLEMGGARVLTDPVLGARVGPLVRIAPPIRSALGESVDAIVLSHLHADRADLRSLRPVGARSPVFAPRGAGRRLTARGLRTVHEMSPGEETSVGDVHVTAKTARHDGRRRPLGGSEAAPIGFLLQAECSIYFAGDTDLYPRMSDLAGSLGVALLPVSGWGPTLGPGHLDPARAEPRVAVPIRWGTFALPRPFRRRDDPERPAREFGALAARCAPDVEVRILAPGRRIELPSVEPDLAHPPNCAGCRIVDTNMASRVA
jgi:L-ascorbate metabolism protein UlaG (beta-lactamase superfamily)